MSDEVKSTERPRIDGNLSAGRMLNGTPKGAMVSYTAPLLASLAAAINATIIHKQAAGLPPLFTGVDAHRVMRAYEIAMEFHGEQKAGTNTIEDQLAAALGVPAGRAA